MNSFHTGSRDYPKLLETGLISASFIRTMTVGSGISPESACTLIQGQKPTRMLAGSWTCGSILRELLFLCRLLQNPPITTGEEFHLALKQNSICE